MSNRPETTLWGFEGLFGGNEKRIHACMPMFRVAGHDAIYVARKANWSLETGDGLTAIDEAEALEVCERLELEAPYPVWPGEIVAVVGPAYRQAIETGVAKVAGLLARWTGRAVQAGFQIGLLVPEAYEVLCGQLHDEAIAAFDAEVRETWCSGLSDRARAALDVLRHTAHGPLEATLMRKLIAHRLRRDGDAYVRTLALGAARMHCSVPELESLVEPFFKAIVASEPFAAQSTPLGADEGAAAAAYDGTRSSGVYKRRGRRAPYDDTGSSGQHERAAGVYENATPGAGVEPAAAAAYPTPSWQASRPPMPVVPKPVVTRHAASCPCEACMNVQPTARCVRRNRAA